MLEIRFHGRGGQGAVLAAKMLAAAYYSGGRKVQAFASYGGERRGAHVTSFLRVDTGVIKARYQIYHPHCSIVLDPGLVALVDTAGGCERGALILVNSKQAPAELPYPGGLVVATVDASGIAVHHGLGSTTTPIVNTAILGAFARASESFLPLPVSLAAVEDAIGLYAPTDPERNIAGARDAYREVRLPAQASPGSKGKEEQ